MGINDTIKAISDPVRRSILEMLKISRMSAGDIAKEFNLTDATVSYHLNKLKKADLIVAKRDKNFIYYSINATVFEDVLIWIYSFRDEEKSE